MRRMRKRLFMIRKFFTAKKDGKKVCGKVWRKDEKSQRRRQ